MSRIHALLLGLVMVITVLVAATPAVAADDAWHRVDVALEAPWHAPDCLARVSLSREALDCSLRVAERGRGAPVPTPFAQGAVQLTTEPGDPVGITLWGGSAVLRGVLRQDRFTVRYAPQLTRSGRRLAAPEDSRAAGERGGPLRLRLERDLATRGIGAPYQLVVTGWLRTYVDEPPWISCPAPPPPARGRYAMTCQVGGIPEPMVQVVDGELPDQLFLTDVRNGTFTITGIPFYKSGTTVTLEAVNTEGTRRQQLTFPDRPGTGEPTVATATTVLSSDPRTASGEPVTFSARVVSVPPGGPEPTGTVQFLVDWEPFGDPVPVRDGVATLPPFSRLPVGRHTVVARYLPSGRFVGSQDVLSGAQVVADGD